MAVFANTTGGLAMVSTIFLLFLFLFLVATVSVLLPAYRRAVSTIF